MKKLIEFGIKSRTQKETSQSKKYINITDEMNQILTGALLGDGSLVKGKNNPNANARFSYSSKSYQHVDYVCKLFKNYASGQYIIYRHRYDKRTNKYYDGYQYQSIFSPTFKELRDKWYIDNIKKIPNDLYLTPLVCKVWYLGDGSLIGNKNNNSQRLVLYTNCFKKEDIENILLPQLKEFDPHLLYMNNKLDTEGYAICIGKKENIIKFINFIGECPFEDYKYKWNVKEPLNKKQGAERK